MLVDKATSRGGFRCRDFRYRQDQAAPKSEADRHPILMTVKNCLTIAVKFVVDCIGLKLKMTDKETVARRRREDD